MSLINQMLMDLEHRKKGQPLPVGGALVGTMPLDHQSNNRVSFRVLSAALGAIVLAGIVGWQWQQPKPSFPVTATDTSAQKSMITQEPNLRDLPEKGVPISAPVTLNKKLIDIASEARGKEHNVLLELSDSIDTQSYDTQSYDTVQAGASASLYRRAALTVTSDIKLPQVLQSLPVLADIKIPKPQPFAMKSELKLELKPKPVLEPVSAVLSKPIKANTHKPIKQITAAHRAEQMYHQALNLSARDKSAQAQNMLKKTLTLKPDHLEARYTLAALLMNKGDTHGALSELSEGLRINASHPPFAMLYGRLKAKEGDLSEALRVMEGARENASRNSEYYAQLGALYQRLDEHKKAVTHFRQAVQWNARVGIWWLGLGMSLEHEQQLKAAVAAYTQARMSGSLPANVLAYADERIKTLRPDQE